jgi:DNA-binding NarL/FixJ family response regulator
MSDAKAAPTQLRTLTDRQRQVLVAISQGYTNQQIGRQLYVAEDTVKQIARRMYHNLGAKDRANAVHIAWQFGILGRTPWPTGEVQ